MPRPDSVSSKTVIDKKRKHLVNQTKTEGVTEKEDIRKPNIICGNVEAGNAWEVFLEEAVMTGSRCLHLRVGSAVPQPQEAQVPLGPVVLPGRA